MSTRHPLPDTIHRSLSVTAQRVEETARELLEMLDERAPMPSIARSYSPEERQDLRVRLERILALNSEFARTFALSHRKTDERQMVHARLTYLWTVLVDSRSARWKSYGHAGAPQGPEVDRSLQAMIDLLEDIV